MSIDIQSIANQAFTTAKQLAPQAFIGVTVKLGPSQGTYNPTTDSSTTTWAQTATGIKALKYNDKSERNEMPLEAKAASFLVDIQDITDSLSATQQDGIVIESISGIQWECYRAEVDPSRSVLILHCRR